MTDTGADFFLSEHERDLCEGITDPAGGDGDGDISFADETACCCEEHLEWHGEHGTEEADG